MNIRIGPAVFLMSLKMKLLAESKDLKVLNFLTRGEGRVQENIR